MSSTSSPKGIRITKYDQKRIEGKVLAKEGIIPIHWNRTKFMSGGNLYEKIGFRWYLMKEDFYAIK